MLVGFILETEDDKMEANCMKKTNKFVRRCLSLSLVVIMLLCMSMTALAAEARASKSFYMDFYTSEYNEQTRVTLPSSANPGYISFSVYIS